MNCSDYLQVIIVLNRNNCVVLLHDSSGHSFRRTVRNLSFLTTLLFCMLACGPNSVCLSSSYTSDLVKTRTLDRRTVDVMESWVRASRGYRENFSGRDVKRIINVV